MIKYLRAKISVGFLVLAVGLVASSSALGQASIVILNNQDAPGFGFNDTTPAAPVGGNGGTTLGQQRLNAFEFAANIWGATLDSGPTITVRASWAELSCTSNSAVLGSAGATGLRQNFPNAPFADTWYPSALANALSGSDTSGPEINARFNINLGTPGCLSNRPWYLGLDGNHGAGIDLVSVLLHEFAHGLGFANFTDSQNGNFAGNPPGFPSVWDRFLRDNSTGKLWVEMTPAERATSATNTGNLVWNGAQVTAAVPSVLITGADSSNRARMYAPSQLSQGSSVSHYDITASPNQLMEPNISSGLNHSVTPPSDLTFPLFRDIGWNSASATPTPTPSPPPNDHFAAAQVISGCSGSVNGTNVSATHEGGEPDHFPPDGGSHSIWYRWQAPVSSSVTFTTAGSGYDTVLAVYTGTAVNALSFIVRNDDVNPGVVTTSSVTFNATAGVTYRIAVDGFDNGTGGDMGPVTLNWNVASCNTGTFLFNQTGYIVNENAGSVTVTVIRNGGSAGAATVNFATSDTAGLQSCSVNNNVASERCDYATTVGTLRFAAGETSKSFVIPIIDDALVEGTEAFNVSLSAPTGASLGPPNPISVTIQNNDANTATQNPIDGVQFFITQQYIDFLGRLPDGTGLANWMATLGGCPNGGFGEFENPHCDRVHVSSGFFLSAEFQQRGYFAYRFYEVALDRRPTYAEFVPDMAQVGGAQSPESEALSKAAYTEAWMQRAEFKSRYDSLSNSAYVNALEVNAEVTLSNKQALIDALNTGQKSRGQVLREIVETQAVADRFFNRAFVSMQYFGYLRRDPDTVGFNNWLNTLNNNPSDFRHMIFGFLFSNEYRQRFGP